MNKTLTVKELGSFDITSGKVRISDPCYDMETTCAGTLENVRSGKWDAYVIKSDEGDWGQRCAVLIAISEDHEIDHEDSRFKEESIDVGVDSGQAGIFDLPHFKDDGIAKEVKRICKEARHRICEDEPWYSICCDRTLSEVGAGVIPFGCVSSSGFGDGGYTCYTVRDEDNEVIAIKIDFDILEGTEACHECGTEFNSGELNYAGVCSDCEMAIEEEEERQREEEEEEREREEEEERQREEEDEDED